MLFSLTVRHQTATDPGIDLGAGGRADPGYRQAPNRAIVIVDNGSQTTITLLAKAILPSRQQHKALRAILLEVFWIRTDAIFSSSMRQATTGFEHSEGLEG